MKTHFKANMPKCPSQSSSVIQFPGYLSRRSGNLRAVSLEKNLACTDYIFSTANNTRVNGMFGIFGKTLCDAYTNGVIQ
jgi:hypothetical protein